MMPQAQRPRPPAAPPASAARQGRPFQRPGPQLAHPNPHVTALVREPHAADQLVTTMRLVKAARFNAAHRLERKQTASLFTQSMVALYFVGLAVAQAVYVGYLDETTSRLMTFIQLVASVFTLMLGLLEAMNDYKMKAYHLHNCALQVAELAQELAILRPADPAVLQDFRRRYNEALKACPVNHSRLDFLCAKLDGTRDPKEWISVRISYLFDVYGLYALFLGVPPLIWWLHR
jgi:hypothetical protein